MPRSHGGWAKFNTKTPMQNSATFRNDLLEPQWLTTLFCYKSLISPGGWVPTRTVAPDPAVLAISSRNHAMRQMPLFYCSFCTLQPLQRSLGLCIPRPRLQKKKKKTVLNRAAAPLNTACNSRISTESPPRTAIALSNLSIRYFFFFAEREITVVSPHETEKHSPETLRETWPRAPPRSPNGSPQELARSSNDAENARTAEQANRALHLRT